MPITAKVAAQLIDAVGTDRVLTVDIHADQIQGFFNIPLDNVYASPVLLAVIWRKHGTDGVIVVSPDVGGVVRARAVAKRLDDADLAIIDKRRPRPNESKVMNIIGDVEGKTCVLIDDMVDTAGTLCQAAQALKDEGAVKVVAYITHPVLSGNAVDKISKSALDELIVDAAAAWLVRDASRFDVICATNFHGDILSDLAAELAGGLGLAGSINAGVALAAAQAQHGSAPELALKSPRQRQPSVMRMVDVRQDAKIPLRSSAISGRQAGPRRAPTHGRFLLRLR